MYFIPVAQLVADCSCKHVCVTTIYILVRYLKILDHKQSALLLLHCLMTGHAFNKNVIPTINCNWRLISNQDNVSDLFNHMCPQTKAATGLSVSCRQRTAGQMRNRTRNFLNRLC